MGLHHPFVQGIPDALSGIFTPTDTLLGIVVGDESAMLAGCMGINGEKVNLTTALRTDLGGQGRCAAEVLCTGTSIHSRVPRFVL
jgi:hypothetical protein